MINDNRLALHGGEPVSSKVLPYAKQTIDEDDIQAVVEVLRQEYVTTGPAIDRFERTVADYVDAKYAVAFSSGTAALHGACFAAGIEPGDEVITTPMTFAATANCILYQGGTPVFADIDRSTYNIDPKAVKKAITNRTKAIIPVDFTGQPADLSAICGIANEFGLLVIEDAAHAFGATYKGRRIGSISDMTMFSFHPVKHITTGEGGIITTNDAEYYERLLEFRTHGITRNTCKFREQEGPWHYEMQSLGFNYRMTDIQAGLGLSQFRKSGKFLKLRRQYAARYNEAFREMREIRIPYQDHAGNSSWHLYVVGLNRERIAANRAEIYQALQKENIGVKVHYRPVYLHPYYQSLGYKKGLCPIAEEVYETIFTLPLFPAMTDKDIDNVIQAVRKVIGYYSLKREE